MSEDCVFCKILKKEIPATVIYENDHILGFVEISPQAPKHYLFIPREHVESIAHLDNENIQIMADLYSAIKAVAERDKLKGFRTVINTGAEGGQSVFHLHAHMLSGKKLSGEFA